MEESHGGLDVLDAQDLVGVELDLLRSGLELEAQQGQQRPEREAADDNELERVGEPAHQGGAREERPPKQVRATFLGRVCHRRAAWFGDALVVRSRGAGSKWPSASDGLESVCA